MYVFRTVLYTHNKRAQLHYITIAAVHMHPHKHIALLDNAINQRGSLLVGIQRSISANFIVKV